MNFKQATDALLESVTLEDLAERMGVSIQTIRQARASQSTASHRPPPKGWELAIEQLAQRGATRLSRLAERLANEGVDGVTPRKGDKIKSGTKK